MGVFDKFLKAMNLSDEDEDYEDEDYEDEEEDNESGSSRSSRFSRRSSEDDTDHDKTTDRKVTTTRSGSKITPLRSRKNNDEMAVCVFKPTAFEDAREIAETLLANQTVIINMEGVDVGLAQRIIDFESGCAYALDGTLQKISNYIFILTPPNVAISGDLQDIVNAFDFSGIQTGF